MTCNISRTNIPCLYILNKIDQISIEVSSVVMATDCIGVTMTTGVGHHLQDTSCCTSVCPSQVKL